MDAAFLLTVGSFLLTILAFLLTIEAFFTYILAFFDTKYDRAKVPPYNGNDSPPPLWCQSPSVFTPIKQSRNCQRVSFGPWKNQLLDRGSRNQGE